MPRQPWIVHVYYILDTRLLFSRKVPIHGRESVLVQCGICYHDAVYAVVASSVMRAQAP